MRKHYFLTLLLTLCFSAFSFGQTTLSAGDLVVISLQADTPDAFRFVPLVDLESGTVIKFTENAWDGTALRTNEATITFTADAAITKGTNISFEAGTSDTRFSISGSLGLSTSGDQMIVYQGDAATPTFIFAVQTNSTQWQAAPVTDTNQSALPTGLTDGVNAVAVGAGPGNEDEFDNSYYAGSTSGTKTEILGFVATASNWNGSNSIGTAVTSDFTINDTAQPGITITAPVNGTEFNPETTEVPVTLNILNFTLSGDAGGGVSDNSGDGFVKTTLQETGEADVVSNFFTATPPAINVVAGRSYTATAELVDNSGNPLTPAVMSSVTFTVASYTQVADIAALRAGTEGNYYELTGQATMTYDAMNSRNQKYIQDGSAAILIDDADGTVTTSYNVGDGITGIRGQLSSFSGVLQFVPQVDPGAATATGLPVTPQVVTIADLDANFNDYESEWITINDVTFNDADGTATFSSGTNYDITDGTNTLVFRTQFSGADFIGSVIPTSSANITGIAAEFNGTSQIFATSSSNIVLSVQRNDIEGYSAYPNPVRGNSLTVTTNSIDKKQVVLFNVLGRKVFSQSFSGTRKTMDIPNLTPGVYVLKVTEGAKIATQKLIIE